jgi:DNA-binding CsgD family transcriptional regulator
MTIYFIQNEKTKSIKIGYTSENPLDRLRTFQRVSCEKLCLLSQIEGDVFLEKQLHFLCIDFEVIKGWFRIECLEFCEAFLKKKIILCCYKLDKDCELNILPIEKTKRTRTNKVTEETMEESRMRLAEVRFSDLWGYEGLYSINKIGNIFSHRTQSYMKGSQRSDGCIWVNLTGSSGDENSFAVGRLVLSTFVENRPTGDRVFYYDGNKLNNNLENLYWSFEGSLDFSRKEQKKICLTDQEVREVFSLVSLGVSHKQICYLYGISRNQVYHIKMGRRRAKALAVKPQSTV